MSIRKCKASGIHPRSQYNGGDELDRNIVHRHPMEVRCTSRDPSIPESDYTHLLSPETRARLEARTQDAEGGPGLSNSPEPVPAPEVGE